MADDGSVPAYTEITDIPVLRVSADALAIPIAAAQGLPLPDWAIERRAIQLQNTKKTAARAGVKSQEIIHMFSSAISGSGTFSFKSEAQLHQWEEDLEKTFPLKPFKPLAEQEIRRDAAWLQQRQEQDTGSVGEFGQHMTYYETLRYHAGLARKAAQGEMLSETEAEGLLHFISRKELLNSDEKQIPSCEERGRCTDFLWRISDQLEPLKNVLTRWDADVKALERAALKVNRRLAPHETAFRLPSYEETLLDTIANGRWAEQKNSELSTTIIFPFREQIAPGLQGLETMKSRFGLTTLHVPSEEEFLAKDDRTLRISKEEYIKMLEPRGPGALFARLLPVKEADAFPDNDKQLIYAFTVTPTDAALLRGKLTIKREEPDKDNICLAIAKDEYDGKVRPLIQAHETWDKERHQRQQARNAVFDATQEARKVRSKAYWAQEKMTREAPQYPPSPALPHEMDFHDFLPLPPTLPRASGLPRGRQ